MISQADSNETPWQSMTRSSTGKSGTRQKTNLEHTITTDLDLREYQAAMNGRDELVVDLSLKDRCPF